METVKFVVVELGQDMCRIVPNDIRTKFRIIADGGCISSLECMMGVMQDIKKNVLKSAFLRFLKSNSRLGGSK